VMWPSTHPCTIQLRLRCAKLPRFHTFLIHPPSSPLHYPIPP
jgi:hypothetical protein